MNLTKVSLVTLGLVLASTASAFAGGVSNTRTEVIKRGTYNLDVNSSSLRKEHSFSVEEYQKIYSEAPFARTSFSYDNGNLKAVGVASTDPTNPDPTVKTGFIRTETQAYERSMTDSHYNEYGSIIERSYDHTLGGYN